MHSVENATLERRLNGMRESERLRPHKRHPTKPSAI